MLLSNSTPSIKSKATSGFMWNAFERFLVTIGQFIIGIVLARLLMPKDFGLIAMLSIFIAISQVFIQSGMGSGLIQKQDRTAEDYSTVFVFNLAVSVLCYFVLFVTAPLIGNFYEMPALIPLTRVLGLNLIINALAVVQRTKLEIEVDFKTLAKVNVSALLVGGGLGIIAAIYGFGVWALVIQTLSISVFTVIGLWSLGNWTFSVIFSQESFSKLFGFGSKLLAAGIYAKSLQEVYNLVIGKAYSASELGFFTQAKILSNKPSSIVISVLQNVSFPILASLQDDQNKMVTVYSRMIKMAGFITFPAMAVLAILAEPLVLLLLTEKWLPTVPLLQWLCFARIITPLCTINMNILNAVGRSDLFLKVDLIKFPIIVIALVVTIPISLEAVVIGQVVTSIISFFINAYMPGKLFGFGATKQLKELFQTIIVTTCMCIIIILVLNIIPSNLYKVVIGLIMSSIIYFILSYIFKIQEMRIIIDIFKDKYFKYNSKIC